MGVENTTQEQKHTTKVWKSLNQECLPGRSRDMDYWWQLTGYHLANMTNEAGYSLERQYQALLFHYSNVVPYLGPAPAEDGTVKWKSLMTIDGSPIEYSWKWPTKPEGHPEIRCIMETINKLSGTSIDPLNQQPGREFMLEIPKVIPNVDFTWAHHFLATLFDHDISKYVKETEQGVPVGGTLAHGVEYSPKGLVIKTYVSSRRLGHKGPPDQALWDGAIAELAPENTNHQTLLDFMKNNSEGQLLKPFMLALDDVKPSEARLKFYFFSPHTSFASVRHIITLGGIVMIDEAKIQELRSLITAVLGLPENYPEDDEIPSKPWTPPAQEIFAEEAALIGGYMYFFDIAPGNPKAVHDVKFYLPVRQYGPDDATISKAVAKWMKDRGRGAYVDGFLRVLDSIAEHRDLSEGKGIQTYLGCIFKNNEDLEVTSYVGPESYHPARFPPSKQVANGATKRF